ncbi:MAG: hypothetical protein WKF89_10730 [Chitinophagaceae bacterium]
MTIKPYANKSLKGFWQYFNKILPIVDQVSIKLIATFSINERIPKTNSAAIAPPSDSFVLLIYGFPAGKLYNRQASLHNAKLPPPGYCCNAG